MAKNYNAASDTLIKKRPAASGLEDKELAEDLLQSKGYVPSTKPRRVNGGQDMAGVGHTERNRARLNSTLSKAPAQAREAEVSDAQAVAAEKTNLFPMISYVLFILAIIIIMAYVVHLCVEMSELRAEISNCKNTLVELRGKQNDLEFQKEKLYNLEEIERIAREEYGMVSSDRLPKEYITSENGDSIQLMDTGEEKSAAGILMSGFGRAVSNMLSYIN